MKNFLAIAAVAAICHEANREYCRQQGDHSQLPWYDAEEWQRKSAITGVEFVLANPDAPASSNHDSWMAEKKADGWIHGPVKDAEKKEHPCICPYEDLPAEQQAKDHLFKGIVEGLRPFIAVAGDPYPGGVEGFIKDTKDASLDEPASESSPDETPQGADTASA